MFLNGLEFTHKVPPPVIGILAHNIVRNGCSDSKRKRKLMEYGVVGTDPLLIEIDAVVMHLVDEDRSELNAEEIEYIARIIKRRVMEAKMQLGEIAHLLPDSNFGGNRVLHRD